MKKTIISIAAAAALCVPAFAVQTFAADILSDTAVYAADRVQIAKSAGNTEWEGEKVFVDPNTVMAVYTADVFDYARTGNFDVKPSLRANGQRYIADAVNEKGDFAGRVEFSVDGGHPGIGVYTHMTDKSRAIDFASDTKRINTVMSKRGITSECKEIKLLFVQYIGYVYYIDNGTSKFLAATNINEVSGKVFNHENEGIVEIGDELKSFADQKLADLEKYKREVLDKLAPGEPPPTGADPGPMFKVDNTPYLNENDPPAADNNTKIPNTGDGTAEAVGAAVLMAAAAGAAVVVNKKRKDD